MNDPSKPSATREYSSNVFRWMTPDPDNAGADVSDSQSWDMYSYAGNNPTSRTDPSGLYCVEVSSGVWVDQGSGGQTCAQAFSDKPGSVTVNGGEATQADYMFALGVAARTARTEIKRAAVSMAINGALAGAGTLIGAGIDATIATGETAGPETGLSAAKVGVNPDVEDILSGLKPSADNTELQGIIDQLYSAADRFPGGTEGAIRVERMTGKPVGGTFHAIKGLQRVRQLDNLLKSGTLSQRDRETAQTLLDVIRGALSLPMRPF